MTGQVKVVTSRGYGFIETREHIDFFFHFTQWSGGNWKQLLQRYILGEMIHVTFEPDKESKNGPKALNVKEIPSNSIQPIG